MRISDSDLDEKLVTFEINVPDEETFSGEPIFSNDQLVSLSGMVEPSLSDEAKLSGMFEEYTLIYFFSIVFSRLRVDLKQVQKRRFDLMNHLICISRTSRLIVEGYSVRYTISGGYCCRFDKNLALGYLKTEFFNNDVFEIEMVGKRFKANKIAHSPFDPQNKRTRV